MDPISVSSISMKNMSNARFVSLLPICIYPLPGLLLQLLVIPQRYGSLPLALGGRKEKVGSLIFAHIISFLWLVMEGLRGLASLSDHKRKTNERELLWYGAWVAKKPRTGATVKPMPWFGWEYLSQHSHSETFTFYSQLERP